METMAVGSYGFVSDGADRLHVKTKEDEVLAHNAPHECAKIRGPAAKTGIAGIQFETVGGTAGNQECYGSSP